MFLLSPLEQFQILFLVTIQIFGFDFLITNTLVLVVLLYLFRFHVDCRKNPSFLFTYFSTILLLVVFIFDYFYFVNLHFLGFENKVLFKNNLPLTTLYIPESRSNAWSKFKDTVNSLIILVFFRDAKKRIFLFLSLICLTVTTVGFSGGNLYITLGICYFSFISWAIFYMFDFKTFSRLQILLTLPCFLIFTLILIKVFFSGFKIYYVHLLFFSYTLLLSYMGLLMLNTILKLYNKEFINSMVLFSLITSLILLITIQLSYYKIHMFNTILELNNLDALSSLEICYSGSTPKIYYGIFPTEIIVNRICINSVYELGFWFEALSPLCGKDDLLRNTVDSIYSVASLNANTGLDVHFIIK